MTQFPFLLLCKENNNVFAELRNLVQSGVRIQCNILKEYEVFTWKMHFSWMSAGKQDIKVLQGVEYFFNAT